MRRLAHLTVAAAVLGLGLCPAAVSAHGHEDLVVGSTASGSGNMKIEYPFDVRPVVGVSDNGVFPGLFEATAPGFMPATDEPPDIYGLTLGTTVSLEITDIDPNVAVKIDSTTLTSVGDIAVIATHDNAVPELSSLHKHPTFRLGLLADANTFGEGRFSFRLKGTGYGDSPIYTLRLSNGYLPPLEALEDPNATANEKKKAVNCQRTVAKEERKFWAAKHALLSKCLDALLAAEGLGKPEDKALAACSLDGNDPKSLVSRIAAARAKAYGKIAAKCGPLGTGSTPFTDSAVQTHLGMASCRAEELIGATYNNAVEHLGELLGGECGPSLTCVGGPNNGNPCADDHDCSAESQVVAAFSCLKNAQSE